MSHGAIKIGQVKPESAEITFCRVDGSSDRARITIREIGQEPILDHVLAISALNNYRREPFDDGTLKVTYLFSRDRASLQFANNGEDRRLVILREPFERLLGSV